MTRQLRLGSLISILETLDPSFEVEGFGRLDSYRGYYKDLAFEGGSRFSEDEDPIDTVAKLLEICRNAVGTGFTGYKGGNFPMDEDTVLWVSPYGTASGKMLVGLTIKEDKTLYPHTIDEVW